METLISVALPENSYSIYVNNGGLPSIGEKLSKLNLGKKILVVSNPEIFDFYGETTINSLTKAGFTVNYHLIPAGESYKTSKSIADVYDRALECKLERSSTMVALGVELSEI